MREINEISTAMAKGFAAEMTEKMNNGMLKKGCPIMRGVLTVKSGKETEIREGVKRVSITVKVNYPFNILKPSNRRIEVIVENGELRNVKEIMYVALDAINYIASDIDSYTKGYWFDIDSQCYPDFVPTIEKYGIEWFERSIAAFYDYLTGLEGAEAEEEITPELDENGLSIEGLEYVNKNMETVDVDMIKECIYEMVELDKVYGRVAIFDFEMFCDKLWTDYVWEKVLDSGCTDEALEAETRYVMEFNDRVRYIVEHDIENMYITYDDKVGFEEPTEEEEVYDAPELDEEIEKIVDEVFDELNPDLDKWVNGEDIDSHFGDDYEPTDEEKELISDIISTVSEEGYWYTCLKEEKVIVDKYIDIDDDLGCFEFIKKGDYYHLFDVDLIEEYIVNAIVAEAGNNCVADVSGAWDEYNDYDEYINWDYISQCVADEFNNAELKDDYLFNYWECADAIYKAIDRHGDEIKHGRLKLNWDIFDEDFAYYMVADDEFADEVMSTLEEWMDVEEWLTYDDGLYLRLPDDEEEVAPVQSVEDYIMDISSRPSYVKKENITIEYGDKELVVGLFGSYFVKLYNDDVHAAAYCSEGLAWGKEDLMFAYDIMDYKSHIWAIVNENRKRAA